MRFTVVTLFPESLVSPLGSSILGQAKKKGLWDWQPLALRSYCPDKHATADDHPFGGGAGMVLKAEPVLSALAAARAACPAAKVLHMSPRGRRLDQAFARELAAGGDLILLCSHYEGLTSGPWRPWTGKSASATWSSAAANWRPACSSTRW